MKYYITQRVLASKEIVQCCVFEFIHFVNGNVLEMYDTPNVFDIGCL